MERLFLLEVRRSMKTIIILTSPRGSQPWSAGNDNMPPGGATPVALPGPLPATMEFPMQLTRGAVR